MRQTSMLVLVFAGAALLAVGLGACEDDGGAPGWNAGLTDGGAGKSTPRDGAADRPSTDAGTRDATVF
jgi:hypothetical protein